jgi:class 3 adenylate cyclase/tetratricopeptide (TPR) repeat protein
VAVFGLPAPRDDDALRAVVAAAETQRALAALNEQLLRTWGVQLTNRTGIASGEAVIGEASAGEHILTGEVVALANKLEQSAPANEVLIGDSTVVILGDDVQVEAVTPVLPKDATHPVAAYRLVCVNADAERANADPTDANPDVTLCSNCGGESPRAFLYCGACGGKLVARGRFQESRKTVTIVFSDVKAATLTGEPLAPEAARDVMARAFDAARRVLEKHGGTVEKFIGDAVMAVFGLPVRHEDDGLRAVRAALDMKTALVSLAETLARDESIRLDIATGVNTGEVVAGDASLGQRLVTGDAVNVAARLEQAAPLREVYIGELTYALVSDAVDVEEVEPLSLKGKARPVPAYRLLAVRSGDAVARRQDTPMVGRERELALLNEAYLATASEGGCRMITLVGDAGVGKTRLTQEFLGIANARARVLTGRCLSYGDGITFWPVVEVVRQAVGIREDETPESARRRLAELVGEENQAVADRVASAVGLLSTPFQVAELFWGIRRFLEILAMVRPVVVLFDDIHWAEPTFLDLIQHLVDKTHGAPVMLLCTARNQLLDDHPDWAERERETRIALRPLSDADAEQVVENLLGRAGIAESVRARIVKASEGNPLFVEQLLSMLIDNGSLRHEGDRWVPTADLSQLTIPPSIHALLAARLDQLPGSERSVVEPASVIGLSFAPSAVRELVPEEVQDDIWTPLNSLARKQLVRAGQAESESDPSYRFQHILIKDAAYQGLLKRSRAAFHERFVHWADRVNAEAGRAQEFEEILGWHLEQAYRYQTELGPLDEDAVAMGVNASGRLGNAGGRAFARGDMPAAANLLERAAALLPDLHPMRPRLLLRLGEARMETGEYETADMVLLIASELAAALEDEGLATRARLFRLLVKYLTDPTVVEGTIESEVDDAIQILERIHDEAGLVVAWRFIANLRIGAAQWRAAEEAVERWIVHARRGDDRVMEVRAGSPLAMAALFGSTPVPEAIARCEELLERSGGDRRSEALILRSMAQLLAMRGEFEVARQDYRRARRTLEELGWTFQATLTSLDSGLIEMLAGDPAAAEDELRRDYETLDKLGERNYITTVAALLAEALYRQQRYQDADVFTSFSAEVAAPDDVTTQFLWRSVRGKLLARAGRVDAGVALARQAVEMSKGSDELIAPANALMDLAEVLYLAERKQEAAVAAAEAIDLFERKGNIVSAAEARTFQRSLELGVPRVLASAPRRAQVPAS